MPLLSAPTAGELIEEIRSNLNQPDSANSFWSDDEILSYLNRGVRRYFMEVVMYMEGHFTTQVDLDIVSGVDTVACPSDFFKVKALYKKITASSGYAILHYRNNLTSGYETLGNTSSESYLPYYMIRGQNFVLRPQPNFSEVGGLRLEYVQFPETMLSGGDDLTSEMSPVFRDMLIAYATWQAKLKESLVTGVDVTSLAKDHLNDQYVAFKEVVVSRSANPTAIQPFNPEAE